MKEISYVLVGRGLTGDSEIFFFSDRIKASEKYIDLYNPLLSVCLTKNLAEDEVFSKYLNSDRNNFWFKFCAGYDSDLDELLDDCDMIIELNTVMVSDDVSYYICSYVDVVDDSGVSFHTADGVDSFFDKLIDSELTLAKNEGFDIDVNDSDTWVSDEGVDICSFDVDGTSKVAYFGYDLDSTVTYVMDKIKFGG